MRFDLVVNRMTARAVRDGTIPVWGGEQWRPFLHVDDASRAMVAALLKQPGPEPEIFNCGTDSENYRLVDLGRMVSEEVPQAEVVLSPEMTDTRDYRVSFANTVGGLGFRPKICLREGIRQVRDALLAGLYDDFTDVRYHNDLLMRRFVEQVGARGESPADVS
jgi:nucleoside-diphosphate-sugar epimerase